jgi:excisionase family DNA binding protein
MRNDNGRNGGDVQHGAARDLLTVEQAAGYLQLSTSSIRSYMRQGKLRGFRIAGLRKVLIPRAELLSLLEPARADLVDGEDETPAIVSANRQPAGHTPVGQVK